jgi:hypothetical protein
MAVFPVGDHVEVTRNVGNIVMDLKGVEKVSISALGGADTITVSDLAATDGREVTLELEGVADSGAGDGQVDAVVVNGTAKADSINIRTSPKGVSANGAGHATDVLIEHAEPTDTLTVNGLEGVDKIRASAAVSSAIALTINQD